MDSTRAANPSTSLDGATPGKCAELRRDDDVVVVAFEGGGSDAFDAAAPRTAFDAAAPRTVLRRVSLLAL